MPIHTPSRPVPVLLAMAFCCTGTLSPLTAADRLVVWLTSSDAALERDLNAQAARGLRLAAVSDGLPCSVTVMQTPERAAGPASYRVVGHRDLGPALDSLVADGFVPRGAVRQYGRVHVVFERLSSSARESWRALEFAELDEVEAIITAAGKEGYRTRLLVRPAFKSWPGLSEKGILLVSKTDGGRARDTRLLIGRSRNLESLDKELQAAIAGGWTLDLLFSAARDGIRDGRRERLALAISRDPEEAARPAPVRLERATSFGIFGSGVPIGGAPSWNDYAYAFTPADRRQIWASPIRLSKSEADCLGLDLKLRFDAPRDLAWSIVALLARPLSTSTGDLELVYVTDQRLGF